MKFSQTQKAQKTKLLRKLYLLKELKAFFTWAILVWKWWVLHFSCLEHFEAWYLLLDPKQGEKMNRIEINELVKNGIQFV
jgi:hypothetical protein